MIASTVASANEFPRLVIAKGPQSQRKLGSPISQHTSTQVKTRANQPLNASRSEMIVSAN
jgi:hypothetical protein